MHAVNTPVREFTSVGWAMPTPPSRRIEMLDRPTAGLEQSGRQAVQ